jgi:hypothetical protein
MKSAMLVLIALYLFIFSPNAKAYWKDSDWNVGFRPVCDGNPEWAEENGNKFLRFTLENGRIGGCKSDNQERHSAPYWERSLVEYDLSEDKYIIRFEARFYKGFVGEREAFMQIHGYTSGMNCKPLLMFKFGNAEGGINRHTVPYLSMTRHADPDVKQADYATKIGPITKSSIPLSLEPLETDSNDYELIGKWHGVKLELDLTSNPGKVSLFWNGKKEIDNMNFINPSCFTPRIDFGIYRPGNDSKNYPNKTSIFDVDKIQIQKLND